MNENTGEIKYAVHYETLDPNKKRLAEFGLGTLKYYKQTFAEEVPGCRGESTYIMKIPGAHVGFVLEGLGTRNLVADAVYKTRGDPNVYYAMGWSAFGTIANDLATSGIPLTASQMYLAAGSNEFFENTQKISMLGRGWADAHIHLAGIYGAGETPMLRDIVFPETFDIAGASIGFLPEPKKPIDHSSIEAGDKIILLASSGPHDNGLTLCRDIAANKLGNLGYETPVSIGQTFGDALLVKTILYGNVVNRCVAKGIALHSAINITGHAWAKLMRSIKPFVYEIEKLPPILPIFRFIQEKGGLSDRNMYYRFNMGAGFALIAPASDVPDILQIAREEGIPALPGGTVKRAADGESRVQLPNGVTFNASDLDIR